MITGILLVRKAIWHIVQQMPPAEKVQYEQQWPYFTNERVNGVSQMIVWLIKHKGATWEDVHDMDKFIALCTLAAPPWPAALSPARRA